MIKLYSFLLIIFFSINTLAHQPRLNEEGDYAMSKDDPYIIKDPEISKAIYSTLDGAEHFYKIKSDEDFNMYAGITVAKQDDCPDEFQKFSFSILDENFNTLHAFDGESFKWWSWYVPFLKILVLLKSAPYSINSLAIANVVPQSLSDKNPSVS